MVWWNKKKKLSCSTYRQKHHLDHRRWNLVYTDGVWSYIQEACRFAASVWHGCHRFRQPFLHERSAYSPIKTETLSRGESISQLLEGLAEKVNTIYVIFFLSRCVYYCFYPHMRCIIIMCWENLITAAGFFFFLPVAEYSAYHHNHHHHVPYQERYAIILV